MYTQTIRKLPCKSLLNMSINELLYYIAFSFYTLNEIFARTEFRTFLFLTVSSLSKLLKLSIISLLLFKFVIQKSSIRTWLISVILVTIGFISWRQSGEGWLFWLSLFVVCAQGVKLKPLAAISLVLTSFMLIITIISARLGFIQDLLLIRADGFVRHALGFTHPNTLGMYLLLICISYSVLHFGKSPLPDIALLTAVAAANILVTDSRSSALLCFFQGLLLIIFYAVKQEKTQSIFRQLFVTIIFLIIILSYYWMVNFNPTDKSYAFLDKLLSGRLRLAHGYYEMQPLTLFGSTFAQFKPIYWENGEPSTFLVDNGYCHLLLRYGLIPSACFLIGLLLLLLALLVEKYWDALLLGLVLCLVFSMSEKFGIRIDFDYFLYALGAKLIYSDKPIGMKNTFTKLRAKNFMSYKYTKIK